MRHAGQAQFSTRPGTLGFGFRLHYIHYPLRGHYILLHLTSSHIPPKSQIESRSTVSVQVETWSGCPGHGKTKSVFQDKNRQPDTSLPFLALERNMLRESMTVMDRYGQYDFVWEGERCESAAFLRFSSGCSNSKENFSKDSCKVMKHSCKSVLDKLCKAFNSHYKAGPTFAIPAMPVPWIWLLTLTMRGFSCKLQGRLLGRCLLHPSTSPVQFISQHVLLYFEFTLLGFKSFYHFYPIRSFLQVSILLFQVSHRFLATFEIISSLFKHALSQLHRIPSFLNSHSTCLLNQSIVHTFTRTTGAHTHRVLWTKLLVRTLMCFMTGSCFRFKLWPLRRRINGWVSNIPP